MSTQTAASDALLTRRDGAVLVLSNNNVAARNALTLEFYLGVKAALQAAAADPTVGAVVLTGEGGHFCAGGDLRQLIKRRELPVSERRERLEGLHDLIRSVRDCPKPVIAAVEGAAAGAACRWRWLATCWSPPATRCFRWLM
jgi:enoyl-CoA hydratase/carnithine racemase